MISFKKKYTRSLHLYFDFLISQFVGMSLPKVGQWSILFDKVLHACNLQWVSTVYLLGFQLFAISAKISLPDLISTQRDSPVKNIPCFKRREGKFTSIKIKIYKTIVLPVVQYGYEILSHNKGGMQAKGI